MATNSKPCGPNAIDEFDDYSYYDSDTYSRSHTVTGTGVMTENHVGSNSGYYKRYYSSSSTKYSHRDQYTINSGITELADNCLSAQTIDSVNLPDTLVKIGSSCFRNSLIKNIQLPDSLEEMGHTNFPSSLECISLPANLRVFPTDNVQKCSKLKEITVHEDNKYFKSIDGILYNHDVTEILICPRAKVGKVIIPKTVKRIADYCFDGCDELTSIEMPLSVESIGCYAFSGLKLDRLTLPNNVTSIGEGCFCNITIRQKFRFSQRITCLPDKCFQSADIPNTNFLMNIEEIGSNCFESIKEAALPTILRLPKIKRIGEYAFKNVSYMKTIELPSSIQHIGEGAFSSTADDLKIVFLSMAPFDICEYAFSGISDNATLYVPSGSKLVFGKSMPWSSFIQIEEFGPEQDIDDKEESTSDDQLIFRLQNIASSITNADRYYLKKILEELAMDYMNMVDEEYYNEAMQIIRYNRRFNPPLIPDLEKELCAHWPKTYQLKLASSCIMNSSSALLSIPAQGADYQINKLLTEESPLSISDGLSGGDINLPTSEIKEEQKVYFSDILRHLQNELSLSTQSIKIAVSWFTNYALFKHIKELAQKGMNVQLIINNDSVNNGGYCLNFNELIEAGVHISLVEYPHLLHHKFCIIDDKVVINGSYNWTRFSENNYENIVIFRNNDAICDAFDEEFENMLRMAKHKDVKTMPESVPLRPEYDRNAFKQYITEELDAEARQTSNQRDKITALQKASKLNPEYLEKINPGAKAKYEEEFKVIEQSETIAKAVVEMVKEKKSTTTATTSTATAKPQQSKKKAQSSTKVKSTTTSVMQNADQQTKIIQQVKASNLLMVLDVSGSMEETYKAGHVTNITKKVVSAALTLSDSQTVSIWEFGNDANHIEEIGIGNISDINKVHCKNEGTYLQKFVSKADRAIKDNSLVIVFTDDDGSSIRGALSGMQARKDVFWQIIVYGKHSEITEAIKGTPNISLVSMTDYASKTDAEITQALLKDYINWKK